MIAATVSLSDAASRIWDVAIVGTGPAGAMAAHQLARLGRLVLLIDRASFPRWKVCGCCLNGQALAVLRAAGLSELTTRCGAVPLEAMRLAAAGRGAEIPLHGGVSLSRETFDAELVSSAIEAGAAFLPQTHVSATTVGERENVRSLTVATQRIAARVVLVADGLAGKLAVRAGVSTITTAPAARIGAGVIAAEAPAFYAPGRIFMACGRFGYLGLVRLEDNRLNLAAAFDPSWVQAMHGPGRAAVEMLAEVGWSAVPDLARMSWRGTPPLTRQARRVAGERMFLLGDAAGYIEPFTGEGMARALMAGSAVAPLAARASECWHSRLIDEWERTYRRCVGRRQILCRALAAALRWPRLTRAAIELLSRAPALASPIVRQLTEPRPSVLRLPVARAGRRGVRIPPPPMATPPLLRYARSAPPPR